MGNFDQRVEETPVGREGQDEETPVDREGHGGKLQWSRSGLEAALDALAVEACVLTPSRHGT